MSIRFSIQRLFRGTLSFLLMLNRLVWILPACYCRRLGCYRAHPVLTTCACLTTLSMMLAIPKIFNLTMSLYGVTNVQHTTLFNQIAAITLGSDMLISMLIMLTQIWQRASIAQILSQLNSLERHFYNKRSFIGWHCLGLLWFKITLSLYELIFNVPFFVRVAGRLGWMRLLAYVITLYIQYLSSILANLIVGILLMHLACLQELTLCLGTIEFTHERQLRFLSHVEKSLLQFHQCFMDCFQFGIFLIIIGNFLNILANIYAMLSYYVEAHGVPLTMSNYVLIVTAELYVLLAVAQACQVEHCRIRGRFMELFYDPRKDLVEISKHNWPLEALKCEILGMFVLDHEFWLFLMSYSMNFIVIILQFTMDKMMSKKWEGD